MPFANEVFYPQNIPSYFSDVFFQSLGMLSVYQQDLEVKYTSSASLTIFFQETTCVKLTENEKVSGVSPAH